MQRVHGGHQREMGKERKQKRDQGREKIERLEEAGILGRKAKLEELRKNINKAMEKLPELERDKLEKEEKMRKRKELQEIKNDLWTHEKRELQDEHKVRIKEIRKLGEKASKIKEILETLKIRKEQ